MLKITILALIILLFFAFSFSIKMLFKGEKSVERTCSCSPKNKQQSGCSTCGFNIKIDIEKT